MAIKSNPTDWATRMKSGVAASGTRYAQGIQNSADWAGATAGAADRYATGVQQAIANGKFQAGVQALGTASWRSITAAKGPAAWQNGVNTSQKLAAGGQKLFAMLNQAESAIASIPRGTYDQNKQRMNTWVDTLHAAKLAGQ